MTEVWKPIKGYLGLYEVSDLGRVRSFHRGGRIMKLHKTTHSPPRYHVELYAQGTSTDKLVHRIVLEAFVGAAPDNRECCHKDGNPANNKLTNLMWGTHRANIQDKVRHGTMAQGERHGRAKITSGCVERMRDMYILGCSIQSIADWFSLGRPQTSQIVRGNAWVM